MKQSAYLVSGIFVAQILNGCLVSQIQPVSKIANDMIGEPLDRIIAINEAPESYASRIKWQEKKYKQPDGGWIYITPMRRDCLVEWHTNSNGIVTGYKTIGERCF